MLSAELQLALNVYNLRFIWRKTVVCVWLSAVFCATTHSSLRSYCVISGEFLIFKWCFRLMSRWVSRLTKDAVLFLRDVVENGNPLPCWGSGSPLRQFIYSEDLAKLILYVGLRNCMTHAVCFRARRYATCFYEYQEITYSCFVRLCYVIFTVRTRSEDEEQQSSRFFQNDPPDVAKVHPARGFQ